MLKHNILLDTFLHAKQIKMYTWEKNYFCATGFRRYLSFNVIGAILCESLSTVCISTVSFRVECRLLLFKIKQASCG